MKNSVKDRSNAQCSCAGHFIESHIDPNYEGKKISCTDRIALFLIDQSQSFRLPTLIFRWLVARGHGRARLKGRSRHRLWSWLGFVFSRCTGL